jgi:hypothetical protein
MMDMKPELRDENELFEAGYTEDEDGDYDNDSPVAE